jgi:hypothetical protein
LDVNQFSCDLVNDEIFSLSIDKLESTVYSETFKSVYTKQCLFYSFIKIFNSTSLFPPYFSYAKLK